MKSKNKPAQTAQDGADMRSHLSIELKQCGENMEGHIHLPIDHSFTMEAMSVVIHQLSKQSNIPPAEVVNDLFCIVMGHVARKGGAHGT